MIQLVRLRNFKCFEDQKFPFAALNLLAGLNGMGKSSLLQALLLLRQSFRRRFPKKRLTLNGDWVNLGTAKDILYEGAREDTIAFELTFDKDETFTWIAKYRTADANVLGLDSEPESDHYLQESLFRRPGFHYLQAERIGPRIYLAGSDYEVSRRGELGSRGEYAVHFLSAFGSTNIPNQNLAHPNAASLSLKDQVEAWIGEVSPGTRINFTSYRDIDLVSLRYSFVSAGHISDPYRATNVGFGITYTLPVVVALLASRPNSLILVENPEAHLHPGGQTKIAKLATLAAASGVQVVIETHSDHVLNGIRLAVREGKIAPHDVCLQFFQRMEHEEQLYSEVIFPRIDTDGRIDLWPEGFFDEMEKNLGGLLRPKD